MKSSLHELRRGDIITIRYRVWCDLRDGTELVERWIPAEIVVIEPDARPIARLADGQVTELRAFMPWRYVGRPAQSEPFRIAA